MIPGIVVFKLMSDYNKDQDSEDRKNGDTINDKSQSPYFFPAVSIIRQCSICRFELSHRGYERSNKRKQYKEVPNLSGQQVFTDIIH